MSSSSSSSSSSSLPPLSIFVACVGGVQECAPLLAVAVQLARAGHTVRFGAHRRHASLVERQRSEPLGGGSAGTLVDRLEYYELDGDLESVLADTSDGRALATARLPTPGLVKAVMTPLLNTWFRSIAAGARCASNRRGSTTRAQQQVNMLVLNGSSVLAGFSVLEKMIANWHDDQRARAAGNASAGAGVDADAEAVPPAMGAVVFNYPCAPTTEFAPPFTPGGASQSTFSFFNRLKWSGFDYAAWDMWLPTINHCRRDLLALPKIDCSFREHLRRTVDPRHPLTEITAYSSSLYPRPKDWPSYMVQSGAVLFGETLYWPSASRGTSQLIAAEEREKKATTTTAAAVVASSPIEHGRSNSSGAGGAGDAASASETALRALPLLADARTVVACARSYVPRSEALRAYLSRPGPVPVYVGISRALAVHTTQTDAEKVLTAIKSALRRSSLRGIFCLAGLTEYTRTAVRAAGSDGDDASAFCFIDDEEPSLAWMLTRVRAIIHSGDTLTCYAALLAGCPQAVMHMWGEQPFNGDRLYQLGCSPRALSVRGLSESDVLAQLAPIMQADSYQERSRDVGDDVAREGGLDATVGALLDVARRALAGTTWRASLERRYSAVDWAPDHELLDCVGCRAAFGTLKRRHHCRRCGLIVCGDCAKNFVALPDGPAEPQRVCDKCAAAAAAVTTS